MVRLDEEDACASLFMEAMFRAWLFRRRLESVLHLI